MLKCGTVVDTNNILKTFTICNEQEKYTETIQYDNIRNIIPGTEITFREGDTTLIFTYIHDIRGKVLDTILVEYCRKYRCEKNKTAISFLLSNTAKRYYKDDSIIDGTLAMCINILDDNNFKFETLFPKGTRTYSIIENNIFKFIYNYLAYKFSRLIGITKYLKPRKFLELYKSVIDPLYNIRNINSQLFLKLTKLFEYEGYKDCDIVHGLSARRTYESMKNENHTCLPITNLIKDRCFKDLNEQINVYNKFELVVEDDCLFDKVALEKQHFIAKLLLCDERIRYVKLIHGPAGSGKTTQLSQLLKTTENSGVIALAPTGMACNRLKKSLGKSEIRVSTIHKFIYSMKSFGEHFTFFVIDESSMVSLNQLYKLCRCIIDCNIKIHTMVFVGDPNQLKPIKRGPVFELMIQAELFDELRLTTVFRTDANNSIYTNLQKILSNEKYIEFELDDSFMVDRESSIDDMIENIKTAVTVEDTFLDDTKIISPYNKSVTYINDKIRNFLFHGQDKIGKFFIGEKIVCTKNLYKDKNRPEDKNVMNGEEGIIESISIDNKNEIIYIVRFAENKVVTFYDNEASHKPVLHLKTSYAITIHASQGSEYENVMLFIPRVDSNFRFITKEMIYTAVSRAKKWIGIYCENIEFLSRNKSKKTHHRFIEIMKKYIAVNDNLTIDENVRDDEVKCIKED